MKIWYYIHDALSLIGLVVLAFIPLSLVESNFVLTIFLLIVYMSIFAYSAYKSSQYGKGKERFSQLEEELAVSSEKVMKFYIGTRTAANGFILMLATVFALIISNFFNIDYPRLLKVLLILWVFFFFMIASRHYFYEKIIFRKK